MITKTDIGRITTTIESMMKYEMALSNFYALCGSTFDKYQDLWDNLSKAEITHAENLQKMKEIILNKPERFESGRPLNPTAINTAMEGLKKYVEKITSGAYTLEGILIISKDIEQSILESHYAEIVKTADIEYQTLMKIILAQTSEHKKMLEEKIQKTRAKS